MKTGFKLFISLLLLIFSINSFGQEQQSLSRNAASVLADEAGANFEDKNYVEALEQFTQLYNYKPSDLYYKLMMGICLTYDPKQKQKAIEIIEEVKITNPEYNLCNFYLGKAYAVNYEFDHAVNLFNMFLARAEDKDISQKNIAKQMLINCQNALEVLTDTVFKNVVENIQSPINTNYSEYVPVISADQSVMIFTYRGINSQGAEDIEISSGAVAYTEDVFISYKENGEWTKPVSIGNSINSEKHDAAIALSVDGQTLFIYKTDGGGDIYMSKLEGVDWLEPQKLRGDVNKEDSWEGSCSLSANGKFLYFSSDRKGGLGKRDIYMSDLKKDGSWGKARNLGPNVNTIYNDDAPFIKTDNKILYFSSQGHTSIGGYDIFSVVTDGKGSFESVENLGFPINTVEDNRYFVLAADGQTGYYSGAGVNSLGEQDIFKITAGKMDKSILALLVGNVYYNDVLTGSTMYLYRHDNGELEGSFVSNSVTGKYVMALTPGSYEIEVELETGETIIDSIRLESLSEYVVINKEFRMYTDSSNVTQNGPDLQTLIDAELAKSNKTIDTLFLDNLSSPIEPKQMDVGNDFVLENILYDKDKSVLRAESKTVVDRLAVILTENKSIKIKIKSHTDSKASDEYNLILSQKRTQSVVDYLIIKGINKDRLVAEGLGESQPIADNKTKEGRQANRRTEFEILEISND
jgi:outer membrane protein OmpA-like peptidoglycan-associated protein